MRAKLLALEVRANGARLLCFGLLEDITEEVGDKWLSVISLASTRHGVV